jgi:hypothetical protein
MRCQKLFARRFIFGAIHYNQMRFLFAYHTRASPFWLPAHVIYKYREAWRTAPAMLAAVSS